MSGPLTANVPGLGPGIGSTEGELWPGLRGLADALRGRRDTPPPPDPSATRVEIHRQPLRFALDWQQEIVALHRRHPTLTPAFKEELEAMGLLSRCVFLSSHDGGPLRFRYIGEPTRAYFGDAWARQQLGKPHVEDPYAEYAQAIDKQYVEAIEGGVPIYNRLILIEHGAPVIYTHMLLGWSVDRGGRRALLACVDFKR
ncbi:hypothetical protein [Azospirillum sp.]|uniref:hypothetical protein n=1 Tax=Azospirillum sp. TaxID=34012 RepID=UPI002D23D7B9|nr:hypothetical protein [Azospirillum sp.]HYD65547.1 hypothetical protein [Azospirillum sp.]